MPNTIDESMLRVKPPREKGPGTQDRRHAQNTGSFVMRRAALAARGPAQTCKWSEANEPRPIAAGDKARVLCALPTRSYRNVCHLSWSVPSHAWPTPS